MSIYDDVGTVLKNDDDLTDAVGSKIFLLVRPAGTPAPFVIYQRVSNDPATAQQGEVAATSRVQVVVWDEAPAPAMRTRGLAIAAVVAGIRGATIAGRWETVDPETQLVAAGADFYVIHKEA